MNNQYFHTRTLVLLGFCFSYCYLGMAQSTVSLPEEEVYVQVVNPVSLTEDYLWLEVSVVSGNKPSISKVIYMELLDRNGISVAGELAKLENGKVNSYLQIPPELSSDNYLLRVYTRISPYISGEKGVFQSMVSIINPQKPPVIDSSPQTEVKDLPSYLNPGYIDLKDSLIEVSLPLPGARDISIVINKASPLDHLDATINFNEMYTTGTSSNQDLIPELYGHIVKGKILESVIDTTEVFFLTLHGHQSHMFVDKPNEKGDVYFDTGNFSYFDYAVIQSTRPDEQVNFILSSPFWEETPNENFTLPVLKLSPRDEAFIKDKILARASHQYYLAPIEIPLAPLPFQYITDYSYQLDDYNRFEDMATTIREYVPMVLVRSQNRKTIFKNFNIPYNLVFKESPLLVIDGMPVFDSEAFANFNPKGIKSMDIVNRYFYINDLRFTGMVNLSSYKNDFGGFDLPKNALFITYKGLQKPYQFYAGSEATNKGSYFPDFRSILTWQSNKEIDTNGMLNFTFKPSLLKGNFELKVRYRAGQNKTFNTANYLLKLN
ncbi:hypothetical protein [Cyclobacterium marinum]|uniref:hypothetical protein n=1 Tax=Cyclobacterium marinum TaxID=104 RepID=UPI0030DCE464|tara:strand:- start:51513 stop:53153 length:1641 start_codon:yes stop_codon:yes gene_type:complete